MPSARPSFLRGWWDRLLGRERLAQPLTEELVGAEVEAVAANPVAENHAAVFPAHFDPAAVEREEEESRALKETLQLEALPAGRLLEPKRNPEVRGDTLAALGKLRQIPVLQSFAQGFMQALNRPEVEIDEVVGAISKDQALCVRVLRLANSVTIASEQRVEDLATAVQLLGVVRVRNAAHALFTLRDAKPVGEVFDWRHLWIHALATAAIAEELEGLLHVRENSQLHLAGLLHDVGKIVLSTIAPEDYRAVLVTAWNGDESLEELERAQLGVDHREAGVRFARSNGLPDVVVQTIAHHDRPELAETHRLEVALVAIANHVAKAHGLGFSGARLGAGDGEFETLPAWKIVENETGRLPDVESIGAELKKFIVGLRAELRELRDEAL